VHGTPYGAVGMVRHALSNAYLDAQKYTDLEAVPLEELMDFKEEFEKKDANLEAGPFNELKTLSCVF
jgi:hypothetical protein